MRVELVAQRRELGLVRGLVGLGDAALLLDAGAAGVIDVEQDHVDAEDEDVIGHRGIGAAEIGRQDLPRVDEMIGDPALEEKIEGGVGRRRGEHGQRAQRQPQPRAAGRSSRARRGT